VELHPASRPEGRRNWFDLDRGYFLMGTPRQGAARKYRELMGDEGPERYDAVNSLGQTFKGDEAFAEAALQKVEVPELIRRSLRVDQIARAVAEDLELNVSSLRTPSRSAEASRARAMTAYLGKLCGRIPYAKTAAFFNRDGSSIAKDVLVLDRSLRDSKKLRDEIDTLARRLIRVS
jgi:chromosomal replication initiation ATPase DnaA